MISLSPNVLHSVPDDRGGEDLSALSPATTTPTATPTGARVDLPDTREGFAPHPAYLFLVAPSNGTVLEELKALLGEEAATQLVADWDGDCNLDQKLEADQVALFLDSNNKLRNREYWHTDDKTTQEEDFTATGYQFASDLAATLLCARIFRKRFDRVSLSEGEQELYQMLEDGVLRSCSGVQGCPYYGCLRAGGFSGLRYSHFLALGSPLSPESK
jgi:hypothetical protein